MLSYFYERVTVNSQCRLQKQNEHIQVLYVCLCVCVHLLCSLCDLPSELVQLVFHILGISISPLTQRQGTHTRCPLFTRWGSLWWTQLSTLTLERGAGL